MSIELITNTFEKKEGFVYCDTEGDVRNSFSLEIYKALNVKCMNFFFQIISDISVEFPK